MTFSDWRKKRKNRQVDLQETTSEPQTTAKTTAQPTQKQPATPSFEEWTRTQQDKQRQTELRSAWSDKPKSFDEWTRKQNGEEAWRDEEAGYNDFLSRLNQYSQKAAGSQGTGYQTAEQAQKYRYDTNKALDELAQQAREYRNFFTANRDRYDEDRANKIFESLDSGDSYLSGARENANQQEAFWKQFQSEDEYNNWKKWQEYEALRGNSDFAEKSQYKSTKNGEGLGSRVLYGSSGYNDVLYDAINGDSIAQNRLYTSNDPRRYDYTQISDETKALFNYIYATQGDVAAYKYLDGAVGQRYDGIDAIGYGALQGSGALSLAAGIGGAAAAIGGSEERDHYKEAYGSYLKDAQGAREQNKTAYSVGNVAGNLGMMYALGGITGGLTGSAGQAVGSAAAKGLAAKGAGKAAQYIVGETVSKAVTSGLTYMAADAVRNSGTYATGNMSGADYWKSLGISGAQGMANGLTNGLVNSGIADVLRRSGNMTLFAEFVRQTVAGTASAAAGMETGYALRGERPDDAQVATDLATAFAFSVLQSAVSSYQTSQANKSAMEAAVREIQSRYSAMTEDWNDMTPEQRADTAARIGVATQQLRADLNSYYIAGQQNTVNDLNTALEIIERGMGNYVSGFTAANGAATASYGGNLLGGETYDFGGATSNIGADVSQEMQSAVEQGVALAQQGGGLVDLPAQDAGVSGGMGAAAATVQTGSDILAQAAREVANGGTVSNTTAQEILADPEAVSTLEEAAGLVVSDEMTRAQQRRAVKSAVEALASAQGESAQPQSEITPLGEATPQEAPETQRTEAIMARDTKAVTDFGTTMGKAGETALTKMYDPQTRADSYIRGMVDYYNAGAQGLDFDKVQTTGTLAEPQKEAAYLAGNADADSNMTNGGQNYGTAEEPAEVHLRNGGQRNYGTDSGGELRAVEGGAGQNPGWHVETQPADAGAAALSYGQEVNTASLGFSGGLEDDAIHLVTGGDTEATSAARSLAESRGLEVTFFGGGNLSIRREDGGIASARAAYVDGNRLYVRADHPEFTAEQLTRHEVGHDMLEKGEIDRDKTMARARQLLGDRRFQESIDQYEAAYRESGLTPEEVRDEVICDSLGRMNIFHGISGMEETAQNILDASFVATEEQKQANGTRGPPDGNVKLSRDMNERNRALRKGEMVNELRDKINWPRYYQEILKDEYNPDHYEDGEIATMDLDGSVLMLQMQRNGEWSVIKMEDSYGNSQGRNGAEAPAKDGQHGISRERKNNSGVGASVRAGTHRAHGEPAGQGGNDQGNGQGSAADSPKAGGKVKTKFSMETPVEETKDLVALHNVSEQGLLGAIDLGGLPSPSIAITKSEMGHTKYGPISLVFSKDTIDPQLFRSNKVYGSDAWTPTAPAVEYPVNSKKLTAVEQEFHKLAKNTDVAGGIFGNSSSIRGMGVDDVSGKSKAELAKALAQTDTIRAAYLADQGKTLEPVKQTKVWDRYGNNSLQSFVDQVGSQRLAEMMTALELGENSQTALGQDAETLDGILRDYYKQSGEAMLQRMAARKKWTAQEIKEQRQSRIDRAMENVTTFAKEDFIRHAWEMYQDGGATKGEIDRLATSDALREAVNDSDVEAWVTQKLDGLLGEPGIYNGKDRYTASGNTRTFKQTHYDYTLENIVKAMKENQQAKGEGIWGASAGSLMAVATPEYASIDEIRADKGRIRSASEEEYNRIKDQLREQIDQVILGIRKTNRAMTDNQFEEIDHIGSALIDGAKGKQTPAAIRKAFQEYGYTVGDNLIAPIQQLYKAAADTPTEYFEAKPQRAVGFDEVLAAVVPDNASEKLVDALGEKGVRVIPYEAGNDTDRIQKANSVEGAKFSQDLPNLEKLRRDSQGRDLTEQQQEYFKDSKVRDKDGALKVMYQGGTGDFTVFDRSKSSYANLYGRGFYFTDSQSHAAQYGNTRSFYLNIQNPVPTDQRTITKPQMRKFLKAVAENDEDFSFENYGQGATVDSVLNSIYGKSDFAMLSDVNQTAIGDMVEAVKLFNEVNGTNFDGLILSTETVTFRSNQAKNTDNMEPTQDPDIRFSQDLPELENLRKENQRLQAQVESWKGQMKRTTPKNRTVRQKDVDKLAKRLISAYDSTLDTAEVSTDLKKLGEYIVRGGDGKNELTWDSVHDSALTIGRKLVENALAADDSAYKAYTELRKYLRDTKITIGPEYAGDIPDFKAFKDSYKGKLRLSLGDKTNVDQVYQELSENWPELFSEAGEAHPTDQILRISDVLDGLTPIYENPHSYDMDRAAEYAAGDILDSIMGEDVRQEPPTFADKQARKLEDAVARERIKRSDTILAERMAAGRAIAKERTIRDQKLQALKDHYAEIQDRRRERREDSNARTRLLKIAKRLQNKKLPAVNRALLDQYIGDLDTAAKSMTGKTLENLSELQSWYTGQKENNPDFIADPNVEKALSRLQKRQISSLTANEVRDLTDVLLNIENEIRTQRKLIDSQDRRDVYHMGQDVIRDVYNTKGSRGGALDKYLVAETLSPVRQIRRMTGYVDTDPLYVLTQGLADGQRDMMAYQMRSSRPFEKFANDKKFNERFSGKKAEKIEIRGVTIQGQDVKVNITPAMRVSLYLHSLNDDNLRHIAGGGITIPDEKLYRKGDMGEAYARGVTIRMTPSDIRAITSKMTDQERSFAKAVQKYFNEDSKTSLNEVSEKLKGYPVAEVENYFPINTDSNFTRSEFESLKRDGTIEGMGFLKERVVAKNPILLRDASDVVDQAIRMHGKYVGLAIPVRNFNKVWNVTTAAYGEDGNSAYPTGSVQSAIENRWGKTGTKYVDKLMGDLQGSTQTKNVWAKALNNVRSNYARAVLTLNLSVAMKQAASYPTAAAVLGWKPLAQAMKDFGKVDLSLIEKYTPLQWYRSKGFSTKELGDMKSGGKSLPQGLNWVQGVDLITTRKLWKASEYYVRDYQKNLAVGSDEYYKAVAQIYNRVIEETQPNYTIMQRPQLLRSDDTLMGNLAMFKTQPFQNTGIVYDAVGNYLAKAEQAKYGGEKAKAEAKAARRNMGWAITSQLGQLAVFAGMTLVWALARGKKDKYEDEDGNLTAGSVLSAVGKDMVGGALSGIPFGSDAWELVSSKLFGDKYYGLDAVTVTAIQDTLEAMNSLTDQLGRIGKAALTGGEINWNSERLKLDTELDSFSKAVGVPYENVLNLGKVVVRQTVVRSLGQNVGEYAYLKLTTDPEKYPSDYYDVLYKAMGDNQEDYEKIYQDMLDFGFDEDKIRNAIEKRMKEDQGVKNASDLDHRYLSPTQEESWNGVYEGLSGSSLWGSATEAQRDAVEDKLYNVVTQNSAGEKLREKIDGGAAYGLDETEYMLYLLALSMADKPTESGKMGSYTNDEVAEAIRMVPGLTDEERSYLWTAQGKNEKSNPWG